MVERGPAAGRFVLGQEVGHDRVPYFFTDQYEPGIECSGLGDAEDGVVCRGAPEDGEFIAFWLRDGRVRAGTNVNVRGVTGPVQELIRSGRVVDPARPADPGVPLTEAAGWPELHTGPARGRVQTSGTGQAGVGHTRQYTSR